MQSIESESLRLEVCPEAGASVVELAARIGDAWIPILRPTPAEALETRNASLMSSFALVPFSNRIADARFSFGGRTYQLRPTTPEGYAMHGDVRKRPWQEIAAAPGRLSFTIDARIFTDPNFPFPYTVRLDYALDGATLASTLEVTSVAEEPMPVGMGFHPYYRRTLLDPGEKVEIEARVDGAYPGLVPREGPRPLEPGEDFSRRRALGDRAFDTCFAGWDGRATVTWPGSRVRACVEADPPLGHLILFAPPGKPFFALEPVSHANNGFNLAALGVAGSGVQVLAPGASMRAGFRLTIQKL